MSRDNCEEGSRHGVLTDFTKTHDQLHKGKDQNRLNRIPGKMLIALLNLSPACTVTVGKLKALLENPFHREAVVFNPSHSEIIQNPNGLIRKQAYLKAKQRVIAGESFLFH